MRVSSFSILAGGFLLIVFSLSVVMAVWAAPAAKRDPRDSRDSISRVKERKDKGKSTEDKKVESGQEQSESLFLADTSENQAYTTELFRCPDCGYEQDESGFCPDHDEQALVLVLSKGRNPLEPAEVDGQEDLLVDLPLTGLQFRTGQGASGSAPIPGEPTKNEQGAPRSPPGLE